MIKISRVYNLKDFAATEKFLEHFRRYGARRDRFDDLCVITDPVANDAAYLMHGYASINELLAS